jgi:hypothetical protein
VSGTWNCSRVAIRALRKEQVATLLEFHVALTNCFFRRWFCVVRGPKPPLHRHNWFSFSKFQDTERFLIPWPRHVSSRLPPSGEIRKYATAPSTQNKIGEIPYLLICSFLLFLSWLLRSGVRKFRRDLWITLYNSLDASEWRRISQPASKRASESRLVTMLSPSISSLPQSH